MVKGYRDLDVWKKAHGVVLDVYRVTNQFPRAEQYGIVSQLRRAAYSIPANISEGFGRKSTRELLQFLGIANGSLEELRYFLLLSRDLRFLEFMEYEKLEKEIKSVAEMLAALVRSLERRASSGAQGAVVSRATDHGTRSTKSLPEGAAH
ncbi:MAG TPA: four helix bundle protein [Candidatus Acidoferrales bacterium]|nr:four helix bundle protein [Candidatus Acidoferrales bacterium]